MRATCVLLVSAPLLLACRRGDAPSIGADPSARPTPSATPPPPPSYPPFEWKHDVAEARARATKEGRPMLFLFTADWSTACVQLEKNTLQDAAVREAARRFVGVRVDCTDVDEATCGGLSAELDVAGLPTIVLFDAHGAVAKKLVGLTTRDALVSTLAAVR